MEKNKAVNVHDAFFKRQMDIRQHAAEMIRTTLPKPIVEKLDFTSLKNLNTSFTDGKVGNYRADAVYECRYGEDEWVTVTLLFEHKSYVEKYPHLQLLQYMCGIWEKDRQNNLPLRPILPILFYHGQPEWPYRKFEEYFEGGKVSPELLPYLPLYEYAFFNLQALGDDWIQDEIRDPFLRMALSLMRNIRSPRLLDKLEGFFRDLEILMEEENAHGKIDDNILYLFEGSGEPEEKIEEVMDQITYRKLLSGEGTYLWRREQRIAAQAREEGIVDVAKNFLAAGTDPSLVSKATGLPLEEVEELNKEIEDEE